MAVEVIEGELYTFHIYKSPVRADPTIYAATMTRELGLGIVTEEGEHKGHLVALITSDYTKCLHDATAWSSGRVRVRPLQPTDAVTIVAK